MAYKISLSFKQVNISVRHRRPALKKKKNGQSDLNSANNILLCKTTVVMIG